MRRSTAEATWLVLDLLDHPQTTREVVERHHREIQDAPGQYQGMPPGLRAAIEGDLCLSATAIYNRLRWLEQQGLVSSLKLPSHTRSKLWWRPRWTREWTL